jgi:phytoene dehydrogenase-like protein
VAVKFDVDAFWKNAVWNHLGAAIGMLENAIRACPDGLWSDPSEKPQWKDHDVVGFWYLVYHALFFLDLDMSEPPESFAPPAPFTLDELDPAGILPEHPYTKDELLKYLDHCREKARKAIATLTEEQARAMRGSPGREYSGAEFLLMQLRHLQHHAAQLNLLLRQHTGSAPRWVRTAAIRM